MAALTARNRRRIFSADRDCSGLLRFGQCLRAAGDVGLYHGPMGLSMREKKALTREVSKRYQKAGKKEKAAILDELVKTTGYNRKYAQPPQFFGKGLRQFPLARRGGGIGIAPVPISLLYFPVWRCPHSRNLKKAAVLYEHPERHVRPSRNYYRSYRA